MARFVGGGWCEGSFGFPDLGAQPGPDDPMAKFVELVGDLEPALPVRVIGPAELVDVVPLTHSDGLPPKGSNALGGSDGVVSWGDDWRPPSLNLWRPAGETGTDPEMPSWIPDGFIEPHSPLTATTIDSSVLARGSNDHTTGAEESAGQADRAAGPSPSELEAAPGGSGTGKPPRGPDDPSINDPESGDGGGRERYRFRQNARSDAVALRERYGDLLEVGGAQAAKVNEATADLALLAAQDSDLPAVQELIISLDMSTADEQRQPSLAKAYFAAHTLGDTAAQNSLHNLLITERIEVATAPVPDIANTIWPVSNYPLLEAVVMAAEELGKSPEDWIENYCAREQDRWLMRQRHYQHLADQGVEEADELLKANTRQFLTADEETLPLPFIFNNALSLLREGVSDATMEAITDRFIIAMGRIESGPVGSSDSLQNLETTIAFGERLIDNPRPGSLTSMQLPMISDSIALQAQHLIGAGLNRDDVMRLHGAWSTRMEAYLGSAPEQIVAGINSQIEAAFRAMPDATPSLYWQERALEAAAIQFARTQTPQGAAAAQSIIANLVTNRMETYFGCWEVAESRDHLERLRPSEETLDFNVDSLVLFETARLLQPEVPEMLDSDALRQQASKLADALQLGNGDPDQPQLSNRDLYWDHLERIVTRIAQVEPRTLPGIIGDIVPALEQASLSAHERGSREHFYEQLIDTVRGPTDYNAVYQAIKTANVSDATRLKYYSSLALKLG